MNSKRFNLFFALFPDDETAVQLETLASRLRDVHQLKGKPFVADRFHLSLYNLGEDVSVPNEVKDAAGRAAASVECEPFHLNFDQALSFAGSPEHHPLVLPPAAGTDALTAFHRKLGAALKQEGLGRFVNFDLAPHVTLFYSDRRVEEHPVEPIGWEVKDFVLVVSHVGETRYDFLGQWPLKGGA